MTKKSGRQMSSLMAKGLAALVAFAVLPMTLEAKEPEAYESMLKKALHTIKDEQAEKLRNTLAGLTEQVQGLRSAKFDAYVPEPVLRRFWSRRHAAVIGEIPRIAAECAKQMTHGT